MEVNRCNLLNRQRKKVKYLILNADDFGLTKGVSQGIIKAMKEGIITSTTVMMNRPYAKKALLDAKNLGIKNIGIHLNLTGGNPILPKNEVLTLVNENGSFNKKLDFSKLDFNEVEKEFSSQIEAFYHLRMKPTHLDSHHHIHKDSPIREIVIELARKYDLAVRNIGGDFKSQLNNKRIYTCDYFSCDFYAEGATKENLKKILNSYNEGTLEIMTHPGFMDEGLKSISSYQDFREKELEIFLDEELKEYIKKQHIELVGYDFINKMF